MKKIGNFEFISLFYFHYGRYEYDLLAPFKEIKNDLKKMKEMKKRG